MTDEEFSKYIRTHKNLMIGTNTIAGIYQWLSSDDDESLEISGLDSTSGLPRRDVLARELFQGIL